uniref:Uncharacterized protein n=1 Tax=Candidatus Kentrum sp. SD TaxID=2126332 RepID=A0A450YKS2_9GAMM|nr:MAG: hypothetical protein BECKSD772F_GA0070984_102912 [Candidatus Kentron sp. SD]VFK42125.1 MAG: hypothetical protein BECKSD772E_GA0070983_101432 [Candidatus Kentron sp. SD]VFK78955.1 MAG: hypothetical protein BECKSD772D_GA0070982_103025 [Candidatus Kentron sp. SD]
MAAITFDTLKFVKTLKDARFDDEQAEAISHAFRNAQQESELATKSDIRLLEGKIDTLKNAIDSLRWILGIIVILVIIPIIKDLF